MRVKHHLSKGGLAFQTCHGCLNYRPGFWRPAGWTGPIFCHACAGRMWRVASGNWQAWVAQNIAYLASIGWRGRNGLPFGHQQGPAWQRSSIPTGY